MRNFNEDYSLVRVLHALVGGEEVDVYINGFPFYMGIRFAQFTPYIYVPEGDQIFTIYKKDEKENPLAEVEIKVEDDKLITAAIIENDGKVDLMPIQEEMGIPECDAAKVKFAQLVPGAPTVNILIDGKEVFNDVEYMDVTDYEYVNPGVFKMDIELAENNRVVISNRIRLNPNKIYTFYAIGEAPNVDIIQTLDGATYLN